MKTGYGPGLGFGPSPGMFDEDMGHINANALRQRENAHASAMDQYNLGQAAADHAQQRKLGLLGMLNGYANSSVGGQNTPAPAITVGGVYTPDQTQAQVNQARAQGDQSAASQIGNNAARMAGRGMQGGSPLLAALNQQVQMGTNANNATAETNIRNSAAGMNAGHLLGTETARSNQWAQDNQMDIARRQQQNSYFLNLLHGLS